MPNLLYTALFLVIVANRLTEALLVPFFRWLNSYLVLTGRPKLDGIVLMYSSWALTAAIVALSGINLFAAYIPSELSGQVLTAITCGGGANFVADLFNGSNKAKAA